MKAVILAGGLGTRLRPLTFAIPKPLLPVGEKPILENLVNRLRECGIEEIIIAVGYRLELIETYFQNGSKFGVKIEYVREEKRLGTAGPLRLVKEKLSRKEPFLVMNGDILTKLDFKNILEVHTRKKAEATIGIREFNYRLPFGAVEINKDYITKIEEKPISQFHISAGIYIFNPEIIELIPENVYFEIPNVITKLVELKKKVAFYLIKEYWRAIEEIEEYNKALDEIQHWEE